MGRHPGSYYGEKRRKEMARQKKQEEKRQRKQQRKASGESGPPIDWNPEGTAPEAEASPENPPDGQD